MNLNDLPTEIILGISNHLAECEVARLLPVNKNIHSQLSEYLLKRNARRRSMLALSWATSKPEGHSIAQRLIQYGADINGQVSFRHIHLKKSTLLHFATLTKRHYMVSMLLELGADPSLTDAEGRTAMYWAYENNDEEAIRCISDKITNLRDFLVHRDRQLTPLHMACSSGLPTLIHEYIDMGLDPFAKTSHGTSPLDHARSFVTSLQTSLDIDSVIYWMRLLVMLGEDIATAHDHVHQFATYSNLQHLSTAPERESVQVGRRWFEMPTVSTANLDNIAASEILDVNNFPSLTHVPEQPPSIPSMTQTVWSPAQLARSVVRHPHEPGIQPHARAPIQNVSDPFPSLTNSQHKTLKLNEHSITTWTTFRERPVQVNCVDEKNVSITSKRIKRRWQPLKL